MHCTAHHAPQHSELRPVCLFACFVNARATTKLPYSARLNVNTHHIHTHHADRNILTQAANCCQTRDKVPLPHAPDAAASASSRSFPSVRMGTVTNASTAVREPSGRCTKVASRAELDLIIALLQMPALRARTIRSLLGGGKWGKLVWVLLMHVL
jgi:hypothetical protein